VAGVGPGTAAITRTAPGIRSEIEVGPEQRLPEPSVINGDNLVTVRQSALDPDPVGRLDQVKWTELDRALRYALDIRY
jgi:mRNA-degrading endonuclease toxin of MazEF toxin-antitoxin module